MTGHPYRAHDPHCLTADQRSAMRCMKNWYDVGGKWVFSGILNASYAAWWYARSYGLLEHGKNEYVDYVRITPEGHAWLARHGW